jgi:outer membrane protein assembly factor BamA
MSIPGIKAAIEEHGITSLAQFYTSKIKYDPDVFAADSEKIRKLLEEKGFIK